MGNSQLNMYGVRFWYWIVIVGVVLVSLFLFTTPTFANNDSDKPTPEEIDKDYEEGDIKQHDMFEFEAFIKHGDISFGTAPFDDNDEPGNDSSDDNGIVRTWDTVTYPLKITVNPKKADMLENIKLKISGTLENGVTDGNRINAKFAVGGKEDIDKGEVSFVQEYTIERTGNSIMIPITVEVQGAKHGVMLRPDIKVEVVSVDGQRINGVVTHFDELPSAMVSAKVSIKPFIGKGLAGQGLHYYPYSGITKNPDDKENVHAFALSWGITPLPNKSNIKGATFPDPKGKINYEITLSGEVAWDSPAKTEKLDFTGRDTPFLILDQRPISTKTRSVGAKNTVLEGKSYVFDRSNNYSAPLSYMTSMSQSHHSVWDSGEWEIEAPRIGKHTVKYDGYNTDYVIGSTFPRHRADGYTGSYLYGVNDRVFSSNAFMVLMPNEYRIGGPNNPDGKRNNVNYRASVKMLSYTDENGNTEDFENQQTVSTEFTERNEPSGNARLIATFFGEPGGATLGTPYIGDNGVSKGDASTINGMDVRFRVGFLHRTPIPGGYTNVYRWNTDAFELTKAYADRAEANIYESGYRNQFMERVKNDRVNQHVYYGVPKFGKEDNVFEKFTQKGKDDYDWYETYEEARQHGEVGAMMSDYQVYSLSTNQAVTIPLRVKHENIGIGSFTKDGSANIAVANSYHYPTEDRSVETDFTRDRAYHNPAIWNENGEMEKMQSPSRGSAVNFETLAVIPAESSTNLTSNKKTFYNSETIKWTAKSGIVIPESGLPDDLDTTVTIKHELPVGLDYVAGSGKIAGNNAEPEIVNHSNGKVTLVWRAMVDSKTHKIPNITFETSINPMALGSGIQSSLEVKSEIESELDMRPVHLRQSTTEVTIIKVGMVGIHQSIDKLHGDKNSDYTVTLRPYTTIEDELNVVGLTHLPSNDDSIGSEYDGDVSIKNIDVEAYRLHDKETVDIYLNRDWVYDDKPNRIDVTKNGWYKYTGEASELEGARSVYFIVNGLMTNHDDIRIHINVQTHDNEFGNVYMNETVINSATDYNLSPISNRVSYTIRPDWELEIERMEIYTNKKDEGLPVRVGIRQRVLASEDVVKNYDFDLVIRDKETGEQVASAKIKQSDFGSLDPVLKNEELLIEPEFLTEIDKGDSRRYEARITNFNDDKVWVKAPQLETDGYVATEKVYTNSDIEDGKVTDSAVTMTERTQMDGVTNDIVIVRETFTFGDLDIYTTPQVTKAGYGYQFTGDVTYENPRTSSVNNRFIHHFGELNGLKTSTDAEFITDNNLLDKTIAYYNEDGSTSVATPHSIVDTSVNTHKTDYEMEKIYIKRGSGETFTQSQFEDSPSPNEYIDSSMIADSRYQYKNMLYVPVWAETGVIHNIGFKSSDVLGSNHVSFDFKGEVEVEASMFNHIDSKTTQKDEIMIHQKRGE